MVKPKKMKTEEPGPSLEKNTDDCASTFILVTATVTVKLQLSSQVTLTLLFDTKCANFQLLCLLNWCPWNLETSFISLTSKGIIHIIV